MVEDGDQSGSRKPDRASQAESRAKPPRLSSRTLFGQAKEVVIEHCGEEYRLRRTRNGRLILTK